VTPRPVNVRDETPMAFVRAVVLAYARRGMDPAAVLQAARIRPEQLDDPDARINTWQMECFGYAAMRELDDEAFGWFSRRIRWGTYGMLIRASVTAPTMGAGLARWCRFHGLLVDDVALSLETDGALVRLRLQEHRPLGPMRECCVVSMLRGLHRLACWFIDTQIPLVETALSFAPPRHHQVYGALFPGPVRFGAAQSSIAFRSEFLNRPIVRDESALRALLQHPVTLMVQPYRQEQLLVSRVRELMRSQPERMLNAEALASALHVSARTLYRQLGLEHTTLQALKDEVRHQRAKELLSRTPKSLKQIALLLGFSSEKTFARAFRRWEGVLPSVFRTAPTTPRNATD
jgi:AraC-like DNA-binding protein